MTRHPIVVPPSLAASEAQRIFSENHIRHLPVVESERRLVGLVTRQQLMLNAGAVGSLNVWEIARYLSEVRVSDIMLKARNVVTIDEHRTIERASRIMAERKIGCLPVVEANDVVVGIVTEIDLLRAFSEMLGLASSGVRVTLRVEMKPGELNRLFAIIAGRGWDVAGAGSFPTRRKSGSTDVVLKIPDATVDEVRELLGAVEGVEIVDLRSVV